ncbi:hypothetical protein C8J56DRAFT_1040362 [Mycena floridula]|nr:hypothetical protein C8J56DRAFT_1040362 [Mycena floridula]
MSCYHLDNTPVTATIDSSNPFSLHHTSRATVLLGPGPNGSPVSRTVRLRHDLAIASNIVLGQDWLTSTHALDPFPQVQDPPSSSVSSSAPTSAPSYSAVLLDSIPIAAQNINMSPISYHCRPHSRILKSLVTGPNLYGTVFSTSLSFHPKPATLETTADILLGTDWLRDCAIHALHMSYNRPDACPALSVWQPEVTLATETAYNRHPSATAGRSEPAMTDIPEGVTYGDERKTPDKDKDEDKDNNVSQTHHNENDFVDQLLDDARNNSIASAGPSSQATDYDAPSGNLPDIVYNPEATAEQQRDNAQSLFRDNIFSHKTTHGRMSVFSKSLDQLRTLVALHGIAISSDATEPGLRDAILGHLLHGKCKQHALGIPVTDVSLCKMMSCGYTSTTTMQRDFLNDILEGAHSILDFKGQQMVLIITVLYSPKPCPIDTKATQTV